MLDPKLTVAVILALALVLFVWGRWRYDVVAVGALLAGLLTGVVPAANAFDGFKDAAVITVALVLVISAAIRQSGVLDRALRYLGPVLEKPATQVVAFTVIVTVLSGFMNNVGALAIAMPLAIAAAERTKTSPSMLLMPMAFGSLLGGLITLIGTPPNILISGVRQSTSGAPFSMFDFAPVGLAVAAAGAIYLSFAWRLLPSDRRGAPSAESRFRIADFVAEASVEPDTKAVGMTIAEIEDIAGGEAQVIALTTGERTINAPPRFWRVAAGDVLAIEADSAHLKRIVSEADLALVGDGTLAPEHLASNEVGTIEVVVTGTSPVIGQSPGSLRLRDQGINLLAMSRQGRRHTSRLARQRIYEGDVLALQGDLDHLALMTRELNLLPLADRKIELGRRANVFLPIATMAVAVALATLEIVPIAVAFLAAVVFLAVARVMRPAEMYGAIDPSIIVLMAALIPVTNAVQSTGGTEVVAGLVASLVDASAPMLALGLVLVATLLVTPVLNNAATVLLMGPIAAGIATKAGLNPDAFLMAVAIGASCDFLTPFGHQSNTLVMGPGGYRFLDYGRLGLPLTLIVIAVSIPMIAWVWPLKAG